MESNLTRFNNQLDALIANLKKFEGIGEDKTILLFELKLNAIKSMNSKKSLECFIKYVYPYKTQIMNKDESFFIGEERIHEITQNLKTEDDPLINSLKEDDEFVLHHALNIQNHWKQNMTETQRGLIWTYFQVLIKLAERYVMEKVDTRQLAK